MDDSTRKFLDRVRDAFKTIPHERQLAAVQFRGYDLRLFAIYIGTDVRFEVRLHYRIDFPKEIREREYYDNDTKWRYTGKKRTEVWHKWEHQRTTPHGNFTAAFADFERTYTEGH